jgi:prepilin-type processing-associated H-X9-DG protein
MSGLKKRTVLVMSLALCMAALAPAAEVNALAKWVPADALLLVSFDGNNPAASKTALHDILNEPEIKAVLQGPLAALKKLIAAEAMKKGGPDLEILAPLLNTKFGIAFVGLAPPAGEGMPPQPEVLVMVETGKADSPAAKAVNLLLETLKTKTGMAPDAFKETKVGGVKAMQTTLNGNVITYATTGGYFVLGTGDALTKALDANTSKLSGSKDFQRVSQVTGGNEVLLLHYAHGAALQKFGMMMPPGAGRLLLNREIGLANIKSLSIAFAPDGKGYRSSLFVRVTGERQGLLKVLAGKPLSPELIKLAPKSTTCFAARSLDLGQLWDFVVQHAVTTPIDPADAIDKEEYEAGLAKINRKLGFDLRKDFVDSIGDEFAVFAPGFTGVVKLKNAANFKTCLAKMIALLGEEMGKERDLRNANLRLSTMQYAGKTIHYVDGDRAPLVIQPCYTVVGNYAVFSLYPVGLKTYLTEMAKGETLADNSAFKAVRGRVGADASALYYANSETFITSIYSLLPWLLGAAKMAPPEFKALIPDSAKMPPASVISKHLFSSVAALRPVKDGLLVESHSPIGLPTPPEIQQGSGVATMAIMAGMLLPALGRARGEARKVRSAANLSQIGKGVAMWMNTKGEVKNKFYYPPSLKTVVDDGVIQEPRVFLNPAGDTKPQPGKFVSDYASVFEMVGRKTTEAEMPSSLPMAWEKTNVHGDGRNVVFCDCHVDFIPEHEFQAMMKKLNVFVKDLKAGKKPKWKVDGAPAWKQGDLEDF